MDVGLGIIGGAVGGFLGGGNPRAILDGISIGYSVGGLLFPKSASDSGNRLDDLKILRSSYGSPIPVIKGSGYVSGTIIWGKEATESKRTSGGSGKPTVNTYTYFISFAVMICEGEIDHIRKIKANGQLLYDSTADEGQKWHKSIDPSKVRIYNGTLTQNPDALIVADKGSGYVPAYRGKCYIVFEDMNITEWGNNVPNLEFLVYETEDGSTDCEQCMNYLASSARISEPSYDFSNLSAIVFDGIVIGNRTDITSIVSQLSTAFFFDLIDIDATLTASVRGSSNINWDIPIEDLGFDVDSNKEEPMPSSKSDHSQVPDVVSVTYLSKSINYEGFTQSYGQHRGVGQTSELISLSIVMADQRGALVASVIQAIKELSRRFVEISLPIEYMAMAPGDIVTLPAPYNHHRYRVSFVRTTTFSNIEATVVADDHRIYSRYVDYGIPVIVPEPDLDFPTDNTLYVFEPTSLIDSDARKNYPTLYFAVTSVGAFDNGTIRIASSNTLKLEPSGELANASFPDVEEIFSVCEIGTVVNYSVQENYKNIFYEDDYIDVEIATSVLQSLDEEDVLNGGNAALWGSEIIQWRDASYLGSNIYRLSGLLRGRRGTNYHTHSANEDFILLSQNQIRNTGYSLTEVGKAKDFKLYEHGVNYVTAPDSFSGQLTGHSIRPWSVCIWPKTITDNDIHLLWTPRARHDYEMRNGVGTASTDLNKFLLNIYSGDYTTIERSVVVEDTQFIYTEEMQIEDFGSLQTSIKIEIAQYNSLVGLGHFRRESL